jgi:hypothetical protein
MPHDRSALNRTWRELHPRANHHHRLAQLALKAELGCSRNGTLPPTRESYEIQIQHRPLLPSQRADRHKFKTLNGKTKRRWRRKRKEPVYIGTDSNQ